MMKLRYFIFCLSVVFIASIMAQAQFKFSYEKNTFISYYGCLGIYPGTSLKRNEKVLFDFFRRGCCRSRSSGRADIELDDATRAAL